MKEPEKTYLQVGLELALAVLFTTFSYYLSKVTGTDWFSRSGAVMCLLAAAATFHLVKLHQYKLARVLKDRHESVEDKVEELLNHPKMFQRLSYASYFLGLFGTAVWGYGDLAL